MKREANCDDITITQGSTNADHLAPADVISVATAENMLTPLWKEDFSSWSAERQRQLVELANTFISGGFTPLESVYRAYLHVSGFCLTTP